MEGQREQRRDEGQGQGEAVDDRAPMRRRCSPALVTLGSGLSTVNRMQDSATAGTPGWRGLAIVAANPRGAIYGTIVATAAGGKSPELILAATVATLLVFWLAHVYADVLDHGLRHGSSDLKIQVSIMGQELSMLAGPAPSILFLLLGALGLFRERLAVRLALWNGVVQLVGWGIEVGRRRGQAWPAALLTGLINGVFGLVIVVLEVSLH
jgi:hypothetical protein